jgi:PQQ-dependent dehydrogenase (methanol/ethanol family)
MNRRTRRAKPLADAAHRLFGRPSASQIASESFAYYPCIVTILFAATWGARAIADDLDSLSRDDKQWVMAAKNYSSTRFSGLKQINPANAGQLQVAWSFSVGTNHGQEAAPIVIGDTLYVVGAYPNEVFALDSVSGDLKWKYSPGVEPAAQGEACCDSVNRGAAYDDGKLFFNTLDNHTVALDAKTGHEIWAAKLGEITRGQTMTMAPLVVQGKVLVGNSGGEMGIRGWLTALDENTGKILWRAYSVGPDADVLIGPRFHPFYPDAKGKDLGVTTWPPGHWQLGGGPVWGWISYDPKTNVIFYGTGNPGPWNSNQRPGDNLWTTTIFARDAATGEALWADVLNPHDLYDTDEVNENILLDLPIDGKIKPVIAHPGRDGFLFIIDRATGQIYSADKFGEVNRVDHFDLKTGRPVRNEDLKPFLGKNVSGICPSSSGVKDWQPSAYSPDTHLLYIPAEHLCMSFKTNEVGYIAGTPYVGATLDIYAGAGGYRGEFSAWDPTKRQKVWSIHEKFPVWTGALATAGNLAVYGTLDRWFKVVNAIDGSLLYRFHAPSGFVGQPVTYQGRDGNQYLAMLSGVGGWVAAIANAAIDPHVRNAALGMAGALGDLPAYTSGGSTLLVFALPRGTGSAHAPAP